MKLPTAVLLVAVCVVPSFALQRRKKKTAGPYDDVVDAALKPQRRTSKHPKRNISTDPLTGITEDPYLVPLVDERGWAVLAATDKRTYKYRPGKTLTLPTGIKQFWLKVNYVPIEAERDRRISQRIKDGSLITGYRNFYYMIELEEVDCRLHQDRRIRLVDYDLSDIILSDTGVNESMETVIPGSIGEHIIEVICSASRNQ